jgi:cytochrome c oxidase cbb3-type subunit 3
MNNPLPRWWMWLFILTMVFAVRLPGAVSGPGHATKGSLKWSSTGQYEAEVAKARRHDGAGVRQVRVAMDGRALAKPTRRPWRSASACSSTTAPVPRLGRARQQGLPEPDRQRLAGAAPASHDIKETITERPQGMMPPMAAAVGGGRGRRRTWPTTCSACPAARTTPWRPAGQGQVRRLRRLPRPDGKGNPALGAPNLTDKIWLHGWGEEPSWR